MNPLINTKADFIKRLYDPARKTIKDWEDPNQVATHKLSFANDNGKWVVYPEVQNIGGTLHDFTDPKYKHGKWDALDSAIQRGDTLQFKDSLSADYFTKNYKKYFPNFNY